MKTLFTPAPWTIDKINNEIFTIAGNKIGSDPEIATLYGAVFYDGEQEELEANARLIAAAPELLQMLIELNNAIDDYWNSDTKPDILVRHINMKQKQAFNLIEKATGEPINS